MCCWKWRQDEVTAPVCPPGVPWAVTKRGWTSLTMNEMLFLLHGFYSYCLSGDEVSNLAVLKCGLRSSRGPRTICWCSVKNLLAAPPCFQALNHIKDSWKYMNILVISLFYLRRCCSCKCYMIVSGRGDETWDHECRGVHETHCLLSHGSPRENFWDNFSGANQWQLFWS